MQVLQDFDPKSRALEDYSLALKQLMPILEGANGAQVTAG
jgi:hypothetical protein